MTSRPLDFKDKVVLITGATSGIGTACAREFAARGARLMLTGRSQDRGKQVVEAIRAMGAEAEFVAGDMRNRGFCDRIVEETIEHLGRIIANHGKIDTAVIARRLQLLGIDAAHQQIPNEDRVQFRSR